MSYKLLHYRLRFIGAILLLLIPAPSFAYSICQILTLYGNAVAMNAPVCIRLSPGTQNLWVCELAQNPDIHTTFNANEPFHITVRTPDVQGKSLLQGNWPLALAIIPGQPTRIANQEIQPWVNILNAVPPTYNCVDSFNMAIGLGRISPSFADGYIQLCKRYCTPSTLLAFHGKGLQPAAPSRRGLEIIKNFIQFVFK